MKKPENILIVRTDKIGDVVLTLPLADIIKKHYPDAKVTFLVKNYTYKLTALNSKIDDIIILPEKDNKPDYKKLTWILKEKKFDIAVTVYPRPGLVLSLYRAGIPVRIGTGYRWYSFLFTKKIYEHRKYGTRHELELNVELLREIGINENPSPGSVHFSIHPKTESLTKVDKIFAEKNINTSFPAVIIHPGSHGSAIDWPEEYFGQLTGILARDLDVNIIVTGSLNEFELCEKISTGERTYNLAGLFTLDELAALIEKTDLLVANSTGPIHIAAALGKPVIGFYPRIPAASAVRWAPYTNKKIIFEPEKECNNCTRNECEQTNCMSTIKPEKVAQAVKKMLSGKI